MDRGGSHGPGLGPGGHPYPECLVLRGGWPGHGEEETAPPGADSQHGSRHAVDLLKFRERLCLGALLLTGVPMFCSMKPGVQMALISLGLCASQPALRSQSNSPNEAGQSPDYVRKETTKLIIEDVHQKADSSKKKDTPVPPSSQAVITMDTYIVRERTPVAPLPHYETPIMRLIKTGTLYSTDDKNVKTTLSLTEEPDTLHTGFARNVLGLKLSW